GNFPAVNARSATAPTAARSQLAARGDASSRPANTSGNTSGPCRTNSCHAFAASTLPLPSLPTALICAIGEPVSVAIVVRHQHIATRATIPIRLRIFMVALVDFGIELNFWLKEQ